MEVGAGAFTLAANHALPAAAVAALALRDGVAAVADGDGVGVMCGNRADRLCAPARRLELKPPAPAPVANAGREQGALLRRDSRRVVLKFPLRVLLQAPVAKVVRTKGAMEVLGKSVAVVQPGAPVRLGKGQGLRVRHHYVADAGKAKDSGRGAEHIQTGSGAAFPRRDGLSGGGI